MPGRAGDFFQRGTDRLGDQFQPGQVAHRGQDVGGVGALRGAFAHESGLLQAGECEVEETVGAVALGEALSEGIVSEVLVVPQPVQPVPHPYRRRTVRIARPRDLRGQRRDLLTGTGAKRQRTPRQLHRPAEQPRACPLIMPLRRETPRTPTESSSAHASPLPRRAGRLAPGGGGDQPLLPALRRVVRQQERPPPERVPRPQSGGEVRGPAGVPAGVAAPDLGDRGPGRSRRAASRLRRTRASTRTASGSTPACRTTRNARRWSCSSRKSCRRSSDRWRCPAARTTTASVRYG